MFHSGLKDGRAIKAGSSGQRLRRSKSGAICQKWRDNREGVSSVPPLPLSQTVGQHQ
jgi:hypothetical protein